jgi:hypothetical protein
MSDQQNESAGVEGGAGLPPTTPARGQMWALFAAHSINLPAATGHIPKAAELADEMLAEYDKRFHADTDTSPDTAGAPAVQFEAHTEGDSVRYESTRPEDEKPDTPLNL